MIRIKQVLSILLVTTSVATVSQTAFGKEQWTADECRSCHDNYKDLSLKRSNSDLHHYLTGKQIRFFTVNAPGTEKDADGLYDCLTCHPTNYSANGYMDFSAERDCLKCHDQGVQLKDRHHYKLTATSNSCASCHFRLPRLLFR